MIAAEKVGLPQDEMLRVLKSTDMSSSLLISKGYGECMSNDTIPPAWIIGTTLAYWPPFLLLFDSLIQP